MTVKVTLAPVRSFAALGEEWQALEAQVSRPGFFRSWAWVGCLADERFPDPMLLRAERSGRTVGLALWNQRRGLLSRSLHLHESGDSVLDAPFVEHNGFLLAHEEGQDEGLDVQAAMLGDVLGLSRTVRLRLNGVEPGLLDAARAAGGAVLGVQRRDAPVVHLDALRAAGTDYLGTRSANTRYQLRRSMRRFASTGTVVLERAATVAEAHAWLDSLIALHEATWRARGGPGAFAHPFMVRFHRTLIERALPRNEVDLLRASAGGRPFGYLYNLRRDGHVYAYQSGLDYAGSGAHAKPGLTCHHLAIERALAQQDHTYDFLAGAGRYKRSLADTAVPMCWAAVAPNRSAAVLLARRRFYGRFRGRFLERFLGRLLGRLRD